jgi:hypothetical protein
VGRHSSHRCGPARTVDTRSPVRSRSLSDPSLIVASRLRALLELLLALPLLLP